MNELMNKLASLTPRSTLKASQSFIAPPSQKCQPIVHF